MASVCENSSTCAGAHGWANPSIFLFCEFVSQMACYLSQLLRRVFVFHQCPLHTCAHHSNFALFAFTTFTEREWKNVGVFLRKAPTFFFFSPTFSEKRRTFLDILPTFLKVRCCLLAWHSVKVAFSPFFLVEKPPFPTTTCEGCESKKARIPGNACACHVRARKTDFFWVKYDAQQEILTDMKFPLFLPPLLHHFSRKNELWALAMKLAELVRGLYVENVFCFILQGVVVKISSIGRKNFTFLPIFLSLPLFRPIYKQGAQRRGKVESGRLWAEIIDICVCSCVPPSKVRLPLVTSR